MRPNSRIRILHIVSGDLWAGAEVQVWQLLRKLALFPDIQPMAILMNEGELARRLRSANVPVAVIDEQSHNAIAIVRRLRSIIKRFQPDIIHSHRSKENLLGVLGNALSARVPMVRTLHGADEHPARWRHPLRRLIANANHFSGRHLTCRVIAVSSKLADSLTQEFGYRNVSVVPNGIDIEAVATAQVRVPLLAAGDDVRHIGFVGRLEPVKRGDIFLRMAAALVGAESPFTLLFHIFGDGGQREELEAMANRLGLASRVRFHGHQPEVVQWLAGLDALVLCSDHEGLPMILLEAMAAGTPVIAHAVGGIQDVMKGDVGGKLVFTHNPEAYARALDTLLREGAEPSAVVKARARLSSSYSAKRNADLVRGLYLKCLNQG